MSKELRFGGVNLGADLDATAGEVDPDAPFYVLVLGDFSGRTNRGICEIGDSIKTRPIRVIDRDNYDEVLEKTGARLDRTLVAADGDSVSSTFAELDDFHPDHLFESLPLFASLRALRRRLMNPDHFASAAEEVRNWARPAQDAQDKPAPSDSPETAENTPADPANLLENIVDDQQAIASRSTYGRQTDWSTVIRDLVETYSPEGVDPELDQLVQCVDEAAQRAMRSLLHHPHFQQLEAIWRSLYWLVRHVETDNSLKIYTMDISKEELAAELNEHEDLSQSAFYRHVVDRGPEITKGHPWALAIGHYEFDDSSDDANLLARLAMVGHAAKVPVVAARRGDRDSLLEQPETDEPAWKDLRTFASSSYLALMWPRYLLRLPYGKRTSPTERIAFEELSELDDESLLWGNPAILGACLLCNAYTHAGWQLNADQGAEMSDFPILVDTTDGGDEVRSCGQFLLSEREIAMARERGLSPLMSVAGQNVLKIAGIQSIRSGPLSGRWR